jgi:hypothetical protein
MKWRLLIALLVLMALAIVALAGGILQRENMDEVRVVEINGREAVVFYQWIKVEPGASWQYVEVAIAVDTYQQLHEIGK